MQLLTEEEKNRIHNNSIRLLNNIGVKIDHDQVREEVIKAGAKPGSEANQVIFPEEMVAEYLKLAPQSAQIATLSGEKISLSASSGQTFWMGAGLNIVERKSERPIKRQDLANIARVAGSQDIVTAVTGTSIEEENPAHRDFVGFRILAENSRKHLRPLIFTKHGVEPVLEMGKVLANGKSLNEFPLFSLGYSIVSPYHWIEIPFEWYLKTRGTQLPMMINAEPLAGAGTPVTLAGSILQSNSEILSGIVVYQVLEPGRPLIYNMGFAHTLDMKSTIGLGGSPECTLMACAGAELAKYYNLPCASWFATDAVSDDYQTASEKTFNGLLHALSGVNVIWGVGQMVTQKAISLPQILLDTEMIGYVQRFLNGIEVNDNSLALGLIESQGFRGQYLLTKHTRKNYRREYYQNNLFNRMSRRDWNNNGQKIAEDIANERVDQIIQNQEPLLDEKMREELLNIEKKYKEKIPAI